MCHPKKLFLPRAENRSKLLHSRMSENVSIGMKYPNKIAFWSFFFKNHIDILCTRRCKNWFRVRLSYWIFENMLMTITLQLIRTLYLLMSTITVGSVTVRRPLTSSSQAGQIFPRITNGKVCHVADQLIKYRTEHFLFYAHL